MGARVSVSVVATLQAMHVALMALAPEETYAQESPPSAYLSAARDYGVPSDILFAIALQESGTVRDGKLIPWPWTLNVAGRPYRFANRHDACATLLDALLRLPAWRVDVGLGQINVGFHVYRVAHPCALLDPYQNLALTALILREHYLAASDWRVAIGRYHRPAGGERAERYIQAVKQYLPRATSTEIGAVQR